MTAIVIRLGGDGLWGSAVLIYLMEIALMKLPIRKKKLSEKELQLCMSDHRIFYG